MLNSVNQYEKFLLLGLEFTFTVDASTLPCGTNGALYFVEMDGEGSLGGFNKAGAPFGTGYCDAQCPRDIKFINGTANAEGWDSTTGMGNYGSCCAEMDIWEANSMAQAYTAHPCSIDGQHRTSVGAGNDDPVCDKDGCDLNPFRVNATDFYGVGKTIDSKKPVTVVTQFLTDNMGELAEIKRKYVQEGHVFEQPMSNLSRLHNLQINSINNDMC